MQDDHDPTEPNPEQELQLLAESVSELTDLCQQLKAENQRLRQMQVQLTSERDQLLVRTEAAKKRVQTMLEKLQVLGQLP